MKVIHSPKRDVECSVVATCLAAGVGLPVSPSVFQTPRFRAVARAIKSLEDAGLPVDMVSVVDRLDSMGLLDEAGGASGVAEVVQFAGKVDNLDLYAGILKEDACVRNLKLVCAEVAASNGKASPADLCGRIQSALDAFGDSKGRCEPVGEITKRVLREIEARHVSKGLIGVPTGLRRLDRVLSGLCPQNLIVLAARPGMGKTALALQVAGHSARCGIPTLVFSLEMSREELVTRLAVQAARVDLARARAGLLQPQELARVLTAGAQVAELPIHIDDTPALTIHEMRYRARRIKPGLILIDYLQLMRPSERADRRDLEIASITAGAKSLAKELGIPVVLLSQLNRDVEKRERKRPVLSDLRDSGSIEQDSDVILFIYRDDYYNPRSEAAGTAEIIVAKHRNGPTGKVTVAWAKESAMFADLEPGEGVG